MSRQPTNISDDQELHTIEQLADSWLDAQPEEFWNPSARIIAAKAYYAGYVQGVSDALDGGHDDYAEDEDDDDE